MGPRKSIGAPLRVASGALDEHQDVGRATDAGKQARGPANSCSGVLYILDQNGNRIHTEIGNCSFKLEGVGPGLGEFFETLWDEFVDHLGTDFDSSGTAPGEWYQLLGPPQATVAIQTGVPARPGAPMIVVADRYCTLRAYIWSPPELTLVWEQEHSLREQSSPAVSGSLVILGGRDGFVRAYDLTSGNLLWEYQAERSEDRFSFLATPAFFLSPIYAVDLEGRIHALNQNGQIFRTQDTGGYTDASPALTLNMLYLINTGGFHAYSTDFSEHFEDPSLRLGESSPAVGPDGAVYVAGWLGSQGVLRAYPAIAAGVSTP